MKRQGWIAAAAVALVAAVGLGAWYCTARTGAAGRFERLAAGMDLPTARAAVGVVARLAA